MFGKKILHVSPPSVQRFNLEDTGKLVAIIAASEMIRKYLIKQDGPGVAPQSGSNRDLHDPITSMYKKMASMAMLIGGALANALAFTSSSYLFHRLSADNIDAERKRHDAAIEKLQAAQIEWAHKQQQQTDFINNQLRLKQKAIYRVKRCNERISRSI